MNLDTFLTIGSSHSICEDYILSDDDCIILSDGCSSSEHSDVGARLVCHTSLEHKYLDVPTFNTEVLEYLGLPEKCIDATCLKLIDYDNDLVEVNIMGDGVMFWCDEIGNSFYSEIKFTNSMPYYFSYAISNERENIYRDQYIKISGGADTFEKINIFGTLNLPIPNNYTDKFQLKERINKRNYLVGIASDGITSFTNKQGEKKSTKEVVKDICKIKTTKGKFLQRRMMSLIKQYEKEGYKNLDDISVGVMLLQ